MAPNSIPITRTKIIVPRRRAEILSRPRLLELLQEFLDGKLTIVAAPAGYGKTSLLIDFVNQIEMPVSWFSLDPLDRDPQRFLAHFVAALQQQFPRFGKNAQPAIENANQDQLNLDEITSTIINDIYENITEHFTIFLDDYHLVGDSKPVETFVNRFIQDVDENCHMVIASRALLTLPDMALMVARSQVNGLSFEELAFRPEEIQKLLQQNYKMNISWNVAQDMIQQTEGWITAILLSTEMKGRPVQDRLRLARVSGIGLYEYMAQQILEQQSPDIQEFLLRSSLLEEFDAVSCANVIGRALNLSNVDWNVLMEIILRNNLFILPVGEDGSFLRYHHLFRDFLQSRMMRERSEEGRKIQIRLSQVYSENGEWERAYNLLKQFGHPAEIADLILESATSMLSSGRLSILTDWLEALPANIYANRPGLISLQGSLAVMRGETKVGLELLSQAIDSLRGMGPSGLFARALVRRSAAYRLTGEYQLAIQDADETLSLPAEDPALESPRAEAMRAKGLSYHSTGNLQEALAWLSKSLIAYRILEDDRNVAVVSMETAMVYKATGNYEAAKDAYLKALDYWQRTGNSVGQANLLNNLGVLQQLQGDYDSAISSLERAILHAQNSKIPRVEAFALTSIGDLYRDLQFSSGALEAYHKANLIAQEIKDRFLIIYLNLAEARLTRKKQESHRANELLKAAFLQAEKGGSSYEINLCKLERGRALLEDGLIPEAIIDLSAVVDYYKTENRIIDAGLALLYLANAEYWLETKYSHSTTGSAMQFLKEMFTLLPEPRKWQPLIAAGIEAKNFLKEVQDQSPTGLYITELLQVTARFEQRLPGLKRQLRHKVTAIPVSAPRLSIRAFGRMQVKLNGHLISSADWKTQLAQDLFFLLLDNPEGLTKEQITSIFWPDDDPNDVKLRFKNVIYRLRHATGKDVILLDGEHYRFNWDLDYLYDVESFLNGISQAEQSQEFEKRISHYKTALHYYKGPYLSEIDGVWMEAKRESLRQRYFETLMKIAYTFLDQQDHTNALTYCQFALDHDPTLEEAHCMAMQIYANSGNRAAVMRQFQQCQQALLEDLDTTPSEQTLILYETLIR
jgi:LuxR family transcriptional regulator, maltose regulon positive regulatory protein